MSKRICTVVGNRPQFVKMAPVSRALAARGVEETVIHTGQHYDDALNDIFFRELKLKKPDIQLSVTGRTHGAMTGELLIKLEDAFLKHKPKHLIVYGDTNSTLAAALAAAKLNIRVAHVEAGPRLYDMSMPEEINRVATDHVSTLLFAPDRTSVENLKKEGITKGVYQTGDVMLDAFRLYEKEAVASSAILKNPKLAGGFMFMTLHRPSNVDTAECLNKIYEMIVGLELPVLFPAHLRTLARMEECGLRAKFDSLPNLVMSEPVGYLDTVAALSACTSVITDSGGLQKEAFYAGKTAVVLLDGAIWPDLLASGWHFIAGTVPKMDIAAVVKHGTAMPVPKDSPNFYGDGHAAQIAVDALEENGFFS